MIEILDAHDDVAVLGPRLIDGAGRLEISSGPMLSPLAELWQKSLVRAHAHRVPGLAGLSERQARRERLEPVKHGPRLRHTLLNVPPNVP